MHAIVARPELELQVVAAGTMVLERFHQPVNVVRSDGFEISGQIYLELEGSTPVTMAKSVGFGILEFSSEFQRLQPDVVLLIGDRYEALAAYMNICVSHIQGGEVSGSIDESARHAISKFAHFHFPSTRRSADYLVRMGENPATILSVGCPSSDIARQLDKQLPDDSINAMGSGAVIDFTRPYLLVLFHPVTTEYGDERSQISELLDALDMTRVQTLFLWPNIDAGADHISKAIRVFRDRTKPEWLRLLTNVGPELYLRLLANAACAIGNSSSFVRDGSLLGTPVVLVGRRQEGRETAEHVQVVDPLSPQISAAIRKQLDNGRYEPSALYGDGFVSARIAEQLASLTPYVQKRLHYIFE
jgi:UDP-hydrolysing UDP-N-acetyl-D-glucosamine 2-epimerase